MTRSLSLISKFLYPQYTSPYPFYKSHEQQNRNKITNYFSETEHNQYSSSGDALTETTSHWNATSSEETTSHRNVTPNEEEAANELHREQLLDVAVDDDDEEAEASPDDVVENQKNYRKQKKPHTDRFLVIQCPPLNRITLGQHKSDNNNLMTQLTNVFCVLFR